MGVETLDSASGKLIGSMPAGSAPSSLARREHRFFGGLALALTLAVFLGFARTYYLHEPLASPFPLTTSLHWHGAAFSLWMLLLVTQTTLISARRVEWHKRLGVAGTVLAGVLIVLGSYVAVDRTAAGLMLDRGVPPLVFLAVPLLGMGVFGGLFAAAIHLRRNSPAHKRLIMLATFELVTAGIARIPVVDGWGPPGFFALIDLFLIALVFFDLRTLRRVHPATLWGGAFFVASQPLRLLVGTTAAWTFFAAWLTS